MNSPGRSQQHTWPQWGGTLTWQLSESKKKYHSLPLKPIIWKKKNLEKVSSLKSLHQDTALMDAFIVAQVTHLSDKKDEDTYENDDGHEIMMNKSEVEKI